MGFTTDLTRRVLATGPLCAGVDPSASLLKEWGLPDDATGLREFCSRCLEGFSDVVPVVKPQVAFFERHGSAGIGVLEGFFAGAREAGLLVIADAKRADIANTVEAYADAWLGPTSPLRADAVTAVPYLGLGSLEPLVGAAARSDSAVIVVIRSSNPEGRAIQEARLSTGGAAEEGPTVEDALLAQIAARNAAFRAEHPDWSLGPIGAVIGATLEPSGFPLGDLGGPILAPGVGAQGAGSPELQHLFAGCPPGTVLPNVSRSVLAAGPDPGALRRAAKAALGEAAEALG
jgi:orotidine-5'-phosphate decarboxylase